jgi:fibrillarin-like rRNA methylase
MQRLIKEAISKKERRSNRHVPILTDAELVYQYHHTPGS